MKIYNLPNALTLLRILATPFAAYALFKNGGDDNSWRIIAWTCFFLIGLTDFFDGRIARSRKQITSFGNRHSHGRALDPRQVVVVGDDRYFI